MSPKSLLRHRSATSDRAELTEGNPLFAEEMVRMLVDRSTLRFNDGRWQLARPVDEVEIPTSVQAVLAARLDALPENEKRVAQDAAVIGRIFWDVIVAHLRERPEDIPVLIRHFVDHFWRRHQLPGEEPPHLATETLDALVHYSWPGNVRELQNVIENLVVLSDPEEEIPAERLSILEQPPELSQGNGLGPALDLRDEITGFHQRRNRAPTNS